jgi:hypothetical protein
MSSYIYPTVFGRNAASLKQLLPKASKIKNRNEKKKKISLTCLGAFEKMFLRDFLSLHSPNSLATSVKLVGHLNNNFYFRHFSIS